MNEELITVATTYDIVEAEFLRNQLENEGFDVFLADENIIGVYNLLANAVGGVKIKVSSVDAEDALAFIENSRNAEIEFSEATSIEPKAGEKGIDTGWGDCEMCQSRNLTPRREFIGWKWILVLFMIPAVKAKRLLVCNNCGFEHLAEKHA